MNLSFTLSLVSNLPFGVIDCSCVGVWFVWAHFTSRWTVILNRRLVWINIFTDMVWHFRWWIGYDTVMNWCSCLRCAAWASFEYTFWYVVYRCLRVWFGADWKKSWRTWSLRIKFSGSKPWYHHQPRACRTDSKARCSRWDSTAGWEENPQFRLL